MFELRFTHYVNDNQMKTEFQPLVWVFHSEVCNLGFLAEVIFNVSFTTCKFIHDLYRMLIRPSASYIFFYNLEHSKDFTYSGLDLFVRVESKVALVLSATAIAMIVTIATTVKPIKLLRFITNCLK